MLKTPGSDSLVDKALLVLCMSFIFLYVGALTGWAPMFRILKSRGVFAELCKESDTIPAAAAAPALDCTMQSQMLEDIVAVALSFFSLVGPISGAIMDRVGFSAALSVGVILQILSYILVINSNSYLVFLGFVITGIGGGFLCVALNVFVAKIFPDSIKAVSAVASALLDTGGVVFVLFYFLYKVHLDFTLMFSTYGASELVLLAVVLVLFRQHSLSPSRQSVSQVVESEGQPLVAKSQRVTFREVMFTAKGIFVVLFPFFEYSRVSWIIATIASQLMKHGDSGTYSIVGAILVGAGVVYVPIVLIGSEKLNTYWSALVLDLLGLGSIGLLLVNHTSTILLACAMIGLQRTWIFAYLLNYVNFAFPKEFRGRAYGLAVFACAFSSLFQVLLIYMTHSILGGDYQYGSYILLSLSLVTIPLIQKINSTEVSTAAAAAEETESLLSPEKAEPTADAGSNKVGDGLLGDC